MFVSDTPVNIEWKIGPKQFVFDDVGGTGETVLILDLGIDDRRLSGISFAWQNRPLRLEEAIKKARQLQTWLLSNGFRPKPAVSASANLPFSEISEEFRFAGALATDWATAESLLASDAKDVAQMHLFTLDGEGASVTAAIDNRRRMNWHFAKKGGNFHALGPDQRQSVFDNNGGYEWFLQIQVVRPE